MEELSKKTKPFAEYLVKENINFALVAYDGKMVSFDANLGDSDTAKNDMVQIMCDIMERQPEFGALAIQAFTMYIQRHGGKVTRINQDCNLN